MKIDDITTLRSFKHIFATRSLTKTSELMGLSKAALSKRLEALEAELGQRLFSRNTRSMTPTPEAQRLIGPVSEIIDKIDQLQKNSGGVKTGKQKIRMTCIAAMSQRFVGRLLAEYQLKHPDLSIELIVTDSVLDLVEHNIDLALRLNPAKHSALVGRKVGAYKLVAVATTKYLKTHKKCKVVTDLLQHKLLFLDQHKLAFSEESKEVQGRLEEKRTFSTNDSPLISQLILRGEAIGLRSSWDVKELIKNKKLGYALPEETFRAQGDFWLLSSAERLQSQIVKELYDFIFSNSFEFLSDV